MILVKAPLRLSFFGGGSDIPSYFEEYGGATLSVAFNKYVYAALMWTPTPHVKVSYSDTEYTPTSDHVKHDIVREALKEFAVPSHIEITSFADLPTVGTGLGASSAFAVALVRGLSAFTRRVITVKEQVLLPAELEIYRVGSPIGYQDHVSAVYGGATFTLYFQGKQKPPIIDVTSLPPSPAIMKCLFIVKTAPRTTAPNSVLSEGSASQPLHGLVDIANAGRRAWTQHNVSDFGRLLHESWELKKQTNPHISNSAIDEMYWRGKRAGLLGGKLLGAGGGGYMLFCATNPDDKWRIQRTVFAHDQWYNVEMANQGVSIVYDDDR